MATPSGVLQNRPVLYLVDASVFIFRAYYSVPLDFTDRDGNPVNAVHGFARFLGDLIERVAPERIAVAFDESLEVSFRNEIYPAYKANREPAPPELKRQFALCRELCAALGLRQFGSSRYEADDIIGTLTVLAQQSGRPVTIVSRDKDLTQLVSANDTYWDVGDAVDNVPGVPGVGRKTAATLLKHFDTLPGVFENLDTVPKLKFRGATFVAQSLREHRESAFLSRQLTGIACDMPLGVGLGDLARAAPDLAAIDHFYETLGFGRLLREQARRISVR